MYLELLFLAYVEGGISPDAKELAQRLNVPSTYSVDLDAAIAEFELDESGKRLNHPRILLEIKKLAQQRAARSKGGKAKATKDT